MVTSVQTLCAKCLCLCRPAAASLGLVFSACAYGPPCARVPGSGHDVYVCVCVYVRRYLPFPKLRWKALDEIHAGAAEIRAKAHTYTHTPRHATASVLPRTPRPQRSRAVTWQRTVCRSSIASHGAARFDNSSIGFPLAPTVAARLLPHAPARRHTQCQSHLALAPYARPLPARQACVTA
jgi:hypothetical protein